MATDAPDPPGFGPGAAKSLYTDRAGRAETGGAVIVAAERIAIYTLTVPASISPSKRSLL